MSAQVITFPKVRAVCRATTSDAQVSQTPSLVRIGQVADEFWPGDLTTLEGYVRRLAGAWVFTASRGEALLVRHSDWKAFRRTVLIRREGSQLRLMIDRPPYGPESIGLFHDMVTAMEVLAEDVGWRRKKNIAAAGCSKKGSYEEFVISIPSTIRSLLR